MSDTISVNALRDDVIDTLKAGLSDKDFALVSLDDEDEFAPAARGEQATVMTLVTFAATSIAAGASYDLAKLAFNLLVAKFGASRVSKQ